MSVRVMLDSGAHAAWTHKAAVSLSGYVGYLQGHGGQLHSYVNLDVIPGSPHRVSSPTQTEEAARASWMNYRYMRRHGLDPMPVYHHGERFYWLEKYLQETRYVGLGGVSKLPAVHRRVYLDQCFDLVRKHGSPLVHGFAVTSFGLVSAYPWHTVDSTSWLTTGGNGSIYVPRADGSPFVVGVADRFEGDGAFRGLSKGNHYLNMGEASRAYVDDYLRGLGTAVPKLQDWTSRGVVNAAYFKALQKATGVRVVFGLVDRPSICKVARESGVRHVLFSYRDLKKNKTLGDLIKELS